MSVAIPATQAQPTSFATPARRRGYVAAMEAIAEARLPGQPVRVYVSAPPAMVEQEGWRYRLSALAKRLPKGVELVTFADAFPDPDRYTTEWPDVAMTLDGMVVMASTKKPKPRLHRLGPAARRELVTLVGAAKPVLLLARGRGLVPVIDCRPKRVGPLERPRTHLTVPPGWDPGAPPESTLLAALKALQPCARTHDADWGDGADTKA